MIAFLTMSCNLLAASPGKATLAPSGNPTVIRTATVVPAATLTATPLSATTEGPSTATGLPVATNTPEGTAVPTPPGDAVIVNTFNQEVYPFKQDGNCSLGEAIWTVQSQQNQDGCVLPAGSTTIWLQPGTYSLTQADNSPVILNGRLQKDREHLPGAGFPVIGGQVTILGNGSIIRRTGTTKFGIFQVFVLGDLTLKDLTVTGGDTTAPIKEGGGALEVFGGALLLDHVTLSGNTAQNGGAIDNQPGPGNGVTLVDSVVSGNTSILSGGGIENSSVLNIKDSVISDNLAKNQVFGGGGIDNQDGQVTLDHVQLVGNSATEGGGLYNDTGTVNITDQTVISGNVSTEIVSFIPAGGGGITNSQGQLAIAGSDILGNQAPHAAGGGIFNNGSIQMTGSVLADDVAAAGGGLFNYSDGTGSVTGSCILQNQAMAVKPAGFGNGVENDNDTPLDAAGNWWGEASGAGNAVTHGVKADSPLATAPDICSSSVPTPFPTPEMTGN